MKQDELSYPLRIRFLSFEAIMTRPYGSPNIVHELRSNARYHSFICLAILLRRQPVHKHDVRTYPFFGVSSNRLLDGGPGEHFHWHTMSRQAQCN